MNNKSNFIMKPTVDFCFKELMESKIVRQGFISAVLGIRPEDVVETELLPTHLRKEYAEDKLGILDVRVSLNGNIQIDMEIQVAQFHLWEDHRRRLYSDKFEVHIVELPKAAEGEYPDTPLLKWAKFIRAETKEEFEMAVKTDPYIEEAYQELLRISADDEKRLEYEARQKAILDHNYLMSYNWEDGYAHGEERGEEKKLISLVIKKMKKNCSVPQIADMLEEAEPVIQEIYDAALELAPDYNADQIMQKVKIKREN